MITSNNITAYSVLTMLTDTGKHSFENMGKVIKKSGDTVSRMLPPGLESLEESKKIALQMFENEKEARAQILNSLNMLNTVNTETPNLMVIPFFFQGKSDEIIKIFKKADMQDKQRAVELLQKLDITNASKYKQELK